MQVYLRAGKSLMEKPTSYRRHTHDTYEIYGFISGDAKYIVEGTVYDLNAGDILLIKKAEAHALSIYGDTPYSRYVVNFNALAPLGDEAKKWIDLLDAKPLGQFNSVVSTPTERTLWTYYLEKIVTAVSLEEKRVYLTVLLNELCNNLQKIEGEEPSDRETDHIITYINDNLMSFSALDEICEHFYISKTHLNRKFKALTGSTVWDYIVAKRLVAAKDMLNRGVRPTEVSERCGYDEYSAFYRAYKSRFGVSPKADYHKEK